MRAHLRKMHTRNSLQPLVLHTPRFEGTSTAQLCQRLWTVRLVVSIRKPQRPVIVVPVHIRASCKLRKNAPQFFARSGRAYRAYKYEKQVNLYFNPFESSNRYPFDVEIEHHNWDDDAKKKNHWWTNCAWASSAKDTGCGGRRTTGNDRPPAITLPHLKGHLYTYRVRHRRTQLFCDNGLDQFFNDRSDVAYPVLVGSNTAKSAFVRIARECIKFLMISQLIDFGCQERRKHNTWSSHTSVSFDKMVLGVKCCVLC